MDYNSKFWRWVFIIFIGIVIHFWRKDIGNGLKEIAEIIYLLYQTSIVIPVGKFYFWIETPLLITNPFLKFILIILYIPVFTFFGFIMLFLLIGFCVFWLTNWLTKWIVNIGVEGLERIMNFNTAGYILSVVVLAYILGGFLYSSIFPWLCQKFKLILSLTIGEFFYYLHRKETERLMQPIYLTLAILMFFIGSCLVIISPISDYLLFPPLKIFTIDQWKDFKVKKEYWLNSKPCFAKLNFPKEKREHPLRKWPRGDSEILLYIPQGTSIISNRRYFGSQQYLINGNYYYDAWYEITYKGKTGWIYGGIERK